MADRIIAIGDIHGFSSALDAILDACQPKPEDVVVTLGDYIDRGPDSRGVFERLIALARECQLVPILGNHDEILLNLVDRPGHSLDAWLAFGGDTTLASYECSRPDEIPPSHIDFLRGCRDWYESDHHFFVHGGYLAELPLDRQPLEVLRWASLRERHPGRHCSGKTAIVGHTSQKNGEILDLGYLKCIDTFIYGDGWLTALDIRSGQVWQADKRGELRGLCR